jgi:dTDP-4-dehydrorhamnose 3,5-epimerase
MPIKLTQDIAAHLSYQRYDPPAEIDGVVQVPLGKHRALEGWFMEVLRLKEGVVVGVAPPFAPAQLSLSWAEPGRINAFHLHPKRVQDELWCVLKGTLLVWLVDLRADSPTCHAKRAMVLSGEEPTLLRVPSGVAHGYQAGPQGALLLYAANSPFDPEDPNEGRLPWDFFGAELWARDRG